MGRNGAETVYAAEAMPAAYGCPICAVLCNIGDAWCIRWNVNNFEVVPGWEDKPAIVTWYGAMAFCRFYGYDLPTEAEWEKAARGPDYDDQDEHLVYPWGNYCSASQAYMAYSSTYSQLTVLAAVSAYDSQINGYGICDVVGNAAEWTRSSGEEALDDYPTIESLLDDRQLPYVRLDRVVKGIGDKGLYYRRAVDESQVYCATNNSSRFFFIGFRPVRRSSSVEDVILTREVYEDFDTVVSASTSFTREGKTWHSANADSYYSCFLPSVGVNGSGGVTEVKNYSNSLYLPALVGRLCFIRLKAKNSYSNYKDIYCQSSLGIAEYVRLPAYMESFLPYQIPVVIGADEYRIPISSYQVFDEIELWTVPQK